MLSVCRHHPMTIHGQGTILLLIIILTTFLSPLQSEITKDSTSTSSSNDDDFIFISTEKGVPSTFIPRKSKDPPRTSPSPPSSSPITEDMIQMILNVKAGGSTGNERSGNNNSNKRRKRKSYRKIRKSSSTSSIVDSSFSSMPKQSSTTIPRKVTVNIPKYGRAEGRREDGVDIWKGIPYAQPPVGSLRFAPPEAIAPWAPSRLDASTFGPDCFQLTDPLVNPAADKKQMSEDCLYLNVFTPAGHAAKNRQGTFVSGTPSLPVMVWLHGGAFQQGGARRMEYDGRRLAEREMVVVTLNYRLGALGFLVSSRDGLYGNFGLMDQRSALDWVNTNIQAFGGDPDNITLFGESAGAVMIGLHLLMEDVGTLFHKAIMQSNPVGYTFRSVIIADFIGEALKSAVDCRDLACLRAERVEEIMRAQSSLMGVPRSVGDFFTWSPTLTKEIKMKLSLTGDGRFLSRSEEHRLPRLDTNEYTNSFVSEWRLGGEEITSDSARWSGVNVSQPLKMLHAIPDDIPIMIGSNRHEGEMFVHSAFPAPMPKAVYWMFVGALFRDSASRVLKHYRGLVDEVEREAEELARMQMEEYENEQEYLENQEQLDSEYQMLKAMNQTKSRDQDTVGSQGLRDLVETWSRGGYSEIVDANMNSSFTQVRPFNGETSFFRKNLIWWPRKRWITMAKVREERRLERMKARALKEAAKVVVDYRPVMSAIINDYLFRCPSWNFAQLLSENRQKKGKRFDNIYVYRFSMPTHIPGYKECWGKACHTAEIPYVFEAMGAIRSNYSTLGPFAQREAPHAPEYPYTEIMAAYRGVLESFDNLDDSDDFLPDKQSKEEFQSNSFQNHTKGFQRILNHFFGDYFKADADEDMANDMSQRWVSFAREANPNYDGSKAEWFPWRHDKAENSTLLNSDDLSTKEGTDFQDTWKSDQDTASTWIPGEDEYDIEEYWSDYVDTDFDQSDSDFFDGDEPYDDPVPGRSSRDRFYRKRALDALELDVREEDVFRTELRRQSHRSSDDEITSLKERIKRWYKNEKPLSSMSKAQAKEAIRLVQELGLIGQGLGNDEFRRTNADTKLSFPELFELSWPPEGRLIERDCTCDFWDRIGYRY